MTITTEELTYMVELMMEKEEELIHLREKLTRLGEEHFELRIEYDILKQKQNDKDGDIMF